MNVVECPHLWVEVKEEKKYGRSVDELRVGVDFSRIERCDPEVKKRDNKSPWNNAYFFKPLARFRKEYRAKNHSQTHKEKKFSKKDRKRCVIGHPYQRSEIDSKTRRQKNSRFHVPAIQDVPQNRVDEVELNEHDYKVIRRECRSCHCLPEYEKCELKRVIEIGE